MSEPLKHLKVTNFIPLDDDVLHIDVKSYYENLAHTVQMLEKHLPTSNVTIVKEIINALEVITKEDSPELVLRIKGKNKQCVDLTKRWVTVKESFNRR